MSVVHSGRRDFAIINRSFWPIYPVIGEALLRLAEDLSVDQRVSVIMQDHSNIRSNLRAEKRGEEVEFFPGKAWSHSGSGILVRALDAIYFMLWVVYCLLRSRPKLVYVSTDPPVLVPFVVMIYATLFKAKFVYHLQDIHPEAANVVMKVNPVLFRLLKWMDCLSMRRANSIITITDEMAAKIKERSGTGSPIHVVSNPAVSFDKVSQPLEKKRGFSFCGNAGRLQRIPLVIKAITRYLDAGGKMCFAFAGGGVHSSAIAALADKYDSVDYLGRVTPAAAAQLNCEYEWALLPIEDEVTRYAFPSKSSSYIFSGAAVLAVCGAETSVAEWTRKNEVGVVSEPDVESLAQIFSKIERGEIDLKDYIYDRKAIKAELNFDYFIHRLKEIIPSQVNS